MNTPAPGQHDPKANPHEYRIKQEIARAVLFHTPPALSMEDYRKLVDAVYKRIAPFLKKRMSEK